MYLLERISELAERSPDRPYLEDVEGRSLSYGAMASTVSAVSQRLRAAGITEGSRVVNMTGVSLENLVVWYAIANCGAIEFAVNPDLRGGLLVDQLRDVEADLVVCDEPERESVADSLSSEVRIVGVVRGVRPADIDFIGLGDPVVAAEARTDLREVAPWDVASVMFTSGTTGRSKGVAVPWHQLHEVSRNSMPFDDLTEDDCFYAPFALHHVTGKTACSTAALLGGRAVIRSRFSVSEYWNDIERHGCTTTVMMGSMAMMLNSVPTPANSPMRNVLVAPLVEPAFKMAEQLDFRICTVFNMTEVSSPISSQGWLTERRDGCGRARPGFECRVVDENDRAVPDGTPGELIIRPAEPWTTFTGYWRNAEATAAAFRNLWFHTGDLVVRDESGWFSYKDRLKDAIRRRGENISSMELESIIGAQPGVEEVAAYGVPSALAEEDVMVALVVNHEFTGVEELHAALGNQIPRYMVPRYYRLVSSLPKTPTEKVRKAVLREEGPEVSDFDSELLKR